MTRWDFGRRLRQAGVASGVLVVATVVIGLALALVLVQIDGTVSSNEFVPTTTTSTSTTTTIPSGDGLQAAVATTGGGPSDCSNAFTLGTVALGAISFDLNNVSTQSYTPSAYLCVTNVGPGEIGNLTVSAVATSSTETGCSANEETVDPEGSGCGISGELLGIVTVILEPFQLQDLGCFSNSIALTPGAAADSLLAPSGQLSPGFFCSYEVVLQLSGSATHDQKLAASTDDVTFTLDVTGST